MSDFSPPSRLPGNDALVALGGFFYHLNSAADAYRNSEERRVDEIKCLRQELDESKQREARMRAEFANQIDELNGSLTNQIEHFRQNPLLRFDVRDVVGAWFETEIKSLRKELDESRQREVQLQAEFANQYEALRVSLKSQIDQLR